MWDKAKKWLLWGGLAAFWLLAWALCSRLVAQELLLPSPWQVLRTLGQLWRTAAFWRSVAGSLVRVLLGFLAAVAVGSLFAVLTTRVHAAHALLSPILHIVRAAPVASFIILAYVWLRVQLLPAFIAFLMVVPIVWGNVCEGIAQTDPKLLEMARVFHFGRRKTLRYVRLPSVKPYFETACVTGLGFAWKSGIAAEVICSPADSIGKQLHDAKAYLETPQVFAWTATVVLLSVLLEQLLRRAVGRKKGRENV